MWNKWAISLSINTLRISFFSSLFEQVRWKRKRKDESEQIITQKHLERRWDIETVINAVNEQKKFENVILWGIISMIIKMREHFWSKKAIVIQEPNNNGVDCPTKQSFFCAGFIPSHGSQPANSTGGEQRQTTAPWPMLVIQGGTQLQVQPKNAHGGLPGGPTRTCDQNNKIGIGSESQCGNVPLVWRKAKWVMPNGRNAEQTFWFQIWIWNEFDGKTRMCEHGVIWTRSKCTPRHATPSVWCRMEWVGCRKRAAALVDANYQWQARQTDSVFKIVGCQGSLRAWAGSSRSRDAGRRMMGCACGTDKLRTLAEKTVCPVTHSGICSELMLSEKKWGCVSIFWP